MGALAGASIIRVTIYPEYRCPETPGIPHVRDPMLLLLKQQKSLLKN